MEERPMKVTLTEPDLAGSYVVAERRGDGSLVLRPEPEMLSDVIAETEGKVFDEAGFTDHLERIARATDDLPPERE
jgi:hypothetical protein